MSRQSVCNALVLILQASAALPWDKSSMARVCERTAPASIPATAFAFGVFALLTLSPVQENK
jgi:hypothetical protein